MSTYAVFGMTKSKAVQLARKKLATDNIPERQWIDRTNDLSDEIMQSNRVVQLSEKFDAPQFAEEFRVIAGRQESRNLIIKGQFKTSENSPKTGKPKLRWRKV